MKMSMPEKYFTDVQNLPSFRYLIIQNNFTSLNVICDAIIVFSTITKKFIKFTLIKLKMINF